MLIYYTLLNLVRRTDTVEDWRYALVRMDELVADVSALDTRFTGSSEAELVNVSSQLAEVFELVAVDGIEDSRFSRLFTIYQDGCERLPGITAEWVTPDFYFHWDDSSGICVTGLIAEQAASLISEVPLGVAVHGVIELEADLPAVILEPPGVHIEVVDDTHDLFR